MHFVTPVTIILLAVSSGGETLVWHFQGEWCVVFFYSLSPVIVYSLINPLCDKLVKIQVSVIFRGEPTL